MKLTELREKFYAEIIASGNRGVSRETFDIFGIDNDIDINQISMVIKSLIGDGFIAKFPTNCSNYVEVSVLERQYIQQEIEHIENVVQQNNYDLNELISSRNAFIVNQEKTKFKLLDDNEKRLKQLDELKQQLLDLDL